MVLALAIVAIAVWLFEDRLLRAAGRLLVADDPIEPVEAIVVSQATGRAAAFEAARLYHAGIAPRIVLPSWAVDPLDDEVRALGIPFLSIPDLARAILERGNVPPAAIVQLPGAVDGSDTEVAAVAAYARAANIHSLMYIAPRTHGARVRWMLRHRLPSDVRVAVRSPRDDTFTVDAWWHSRDQSRDVMAEMLRWANTVLLGDAWRAPQPRTQTVR